MLALLFPGQGSQEVGMGRDVAEASPAARAVFDEADAALGLPLSRLCFEGPEEELRRTEIQQPAVLATSIALFRALEERLEREGRPPLEVACVLGHSLGEYSALVAVGSLGLADAVSLVHARGRYMQEAVSEGRGAMAAVMGVAAEAVEEACRLAAQECGEVVSPANYNGPGQTVIAGSARAVARAGELAKQRGARRVIALPVSAPFHCDLMIPAAEKLAPELEARTFRTPRVPVVHNVTAEPNRDAAAIPALLVRQVTAPVRFTECVTRLRPLGATSVAEIGPGRVLSGLVARIERGLERANAGNMQEVLRFAGANQAAATAAL
jgi:[acyl-carrier-protein] S-malonyltransferase